MSNLNRMQREVEQILKKLDPPERETRLPYVVIDIESGAALPGWEAHNQEHQRLARRQGVATKVYGQDPSDDGTEA